MMDPQTICLRQQRPRTTLRHSVRGQNCSAMAEWEEEARCWRSPNDGNSTTGLLSSSGQMHGLVSVHLIVTAVSRAALMLCCLLALGVLPIFQWDTHLEL